MSLRIRVLVCCIAIQEVPSKQVTTTLGANSTVRAIEIEDAVVIEKIKHDWTPPTQDDPNT